MGLFSKLFNREPEVKEEKIFSFAKGKIVELAEVPDPVFAQKMMGDGFAIIPSEGKVVSPVDGEIVNIFPTKHAIGIKTSHNVEILIHIGLETVSMQGEGFETHVSVGDVVKTGDVLVTFDLSLIEEKAKATITPCIITNMDVVESLDIVKLNTEIDFKEEALVLKLK